VKHQQPIYDACVALTLFTKYPGLPLFSSPLVVHQMKLNLMSKAMPQQQSLGQREKVRPAMCPNQINARR